MNLHITNKVKDKSHVPLFDSPSTSYPAFLESWYANLFILNRKKYFIFTEALTLYSTVVSSNQVNDGKTFQRLATDILFDHFKRDARLPIRLFESIADKVLLCKTVNRRVLGPQNELIWMSQSGFAYDRREDFDKLNDTPLSMLKYSPRDAFEKQTANLLNDGRSLGDGTEI